MVGKLKRRSGTSTAVIGKVLQSYAFRGNDGQFGHGEHAVEKNKSEDN